MNILVLGLGNPIRTDDGVGVHAVQKLSTESILPPNVRIIEGGTLGLDLLPSLHGATHLLALDAVDNGGPPGTLSRFAGEELANLPINKSVHLLGFADLLGAMNLLGDCPDEIVLLGIQPQSTDWGTKLTPVVDAAVNNLLEIALAQVSDWRGSNAGQEQIRMSCCSVEARE
jgi:hydrogenase maturation protease